MTRRPDTPQPHEYAQIEGVEFMSVAIDRNGYVWQLSDDGTWLTSAPEHNDRYEYGDLEGPDLVDIYGPLTVLTPKTEGVTVTRKLGLTPEELLEIANAADYKVRAFRNEGRRAEAADLESLVDRLALWAAEAIAEANRIGGPLT